MSLPLPLATARIPPFFLNTDHRQRSLAQLRGKTTGLEKYIYLNGLKERDPNLFYEILLGNMLEIIPILYTPTVRFLFWFFGGKGPLIPDQHLITLTFFVGWGCLLKLFTHLAPSRRSLRDHRKQGPHSPSPPVVADWSGCEDCGRYRWCVSSRPLFIFDRLQAVSAVGSRILGLGDLGANGLPIAIGKL